MTENEIEKQRERVKHFALKKLGTPYKYGVKKSEIGKFFDCSSFTQYLYKRIGIDIPRSTILQASCGRVVGNPRHQQKFQAKDLQTGDLLFFKGTKGHFTPEFPDGIGHVIMYLGDSRFIHAGGNGGKPKVKLEKFQKVISRPDLQIIKRILKG
ncbi:MAG TPA: C40 family peptidase [Candidatus Paceibacterota bacterium]|nr:C40 family peptidase [Candidatus Paceibacterota bacterium]